jgi:hypothetical protein
MAENLDVQIIDTRRPRAIVTDAIAWSVVFAGSAGMLACLPRGAWFDRLAGAGADAALPGADPPLHVTSWLRMLVDFSPGLAWAGMALCALALAAAGGLLQRRNWARLVLQFLFATAAALLLVGLILQFALPWQLPDMLARELAAESAPFRANLAWILGVARAALLVLGLALGVLAILLVRYLGSRSVRAEFSLDWGAQ